MPVGRLWALDGARLSMDRAELADDAPAGPVELVVPSHLIEHDHGLVLFDTGLAPEAADDPVAAYGEIGEQIVFRPDQRVDRQVEALGFAVDDVTHVVLSHVHFDHTGGLRLFPHARFFVGAGDRDTVFGEADLGRDADLAPTRGFDWTFVEGDHDLFDDGRVVMLAMPGHTPGNASLLVRLAERTLLFTGDTAHLHRVVRSHAPMGADTDRRGAVRSLERLDALATQYDAEVWVAHDPDDWARFGAPGRIA